MTDKKVSKKENGEAEQQARRVKKSASQSAKEWAKSIVIALVIWFFLRALLVEAFRIPSGSMENTLLIGDFLFVNKALYGAEIPIINKRLPAFRDPRRFDIVIFDSPEEPGVNVVKRVIGLPGDTISMVGNVAYVGGRRLDEPYTTSTDPTNDTEDPRMREWQVHYLVGRDRRTYRPTLKNWGPLVVPPDSFFVMGDNRDNSYDSRYWGFLGRDRVAGRPLFIYYSYDRNGVMPLPFLTSVRWRRVFSSPK
ncbi:MAG: signal peptidase I [Gemmatimonadales bacterium]|nr:signal peptidase I [Gemmatimonadales bacterium]NIN10108.1 signal peptidase I [Gemmatimonadales bacterium]NIR02592.1 signal peptidase I [Gemmatimonadales bacterium]NIS66286.1 signal peptidase I [Gemmatimonadales bacterium]